MKKFISLSCAALLFVGCSSATPPPAPTSDAGEQQQVEKKLLVSTSFYPLTHFVHQVAGDLVDVRQITSQGSDPHSYEPTPKQVKQIFESDLLIFNGAGQDAYADRLREELEENGAKILFATELVERMGYEEHDDHDDHEDEHHDEDDHDDHDDHEDDHDDHDDHEDEHHDEDDHDDHEDDHDDHDDHEDDHDDHDDHHDHAHGEWDPHVWLDPVRVQTIAQSIASALAELDPSHAQQYKANADKYVAELKTLDADIKAGLAQCELDAVIVSHDAYRYMAARYGFHTLEIAGLSPSMEPSPARLAELTEISEEEGISHVFFETHVSPALSEALAAEIGAETLVLHSLEALTKQERADGETYVSIMRMNLANLRTAMQCS